MRALTPRSPRRHRLRLSVAALGLLVSLGCPGAQLEYDLITGKQKVAQIARVADNKLLVKALGGDANKDLAFDAENDVLLIIDHGKRSYIQLDNPTLDEAAAVMSAVSQQVGASSGVIAGVLHNLGIPVTAEDITTTATGRELTVGGYRCDLYRSTAQEQLVAEICVTDETALPLAGSETRTLRRFVAFGSRMMQRADKLLALLGIRLPPLAVDYNARLPIAVYAAQDNTEVRLTRVVPSTIPVSIDLPANYTRTRIPFLGP